MPLPYLAIAIFALAALILILLGRLTHRPVQPRDPAITIGMTEAEVLAALGPPAEVRRDGDPLDPDYFADGIRATYVYEGRGVVRFVRGVVHEVGRDLPLPMVEGEAVSLAGGPRSFPGTFFAASPAAGSLPLDEVEEVETIPLEDEFPSPIAAE
jgi:hypothetical protein